MAEGEAPGVAGQFQRHFGGGGHDDGEGAGPEAAREELEAHGYFASEVFYHHEVIDKQGKAAGGLAPLGGEDLADGGEVEGIGYEHVEGVGWDCDYPALANDFGSSTNDIGIGGCRVNFYEVCYHCKNLNSSSEGGCQGCWQWGQ